MPCTANTARRSCAQGHQPCPTPFTCSGGAPCALRQSDGGENVPPERDLTLAALYIIGAGLLGLVLVLPLIYGR